MFTFLCKNVNICDFPISLIISSLEKEKQPNVFMSIGRHCQVVAMNNTRYNGIDKVGVHITMITLHFLSFFPVKD